MNATPMKKPSGDQLKNVPLDMLQPHPQNPRRIERRDVIDAIAAQLRESGEFHPAHALLVRPVNGKLQIVSGHNRVIAAREAGFKEVPAWVREMDDAEAFMQLLLCNAQGQLHPLEKGEHARLAVDKGGMKLADYARGINENEDTVKNWFLAARVAQKRCTDTPFESILPYMKHLRLIHSANHDTWAEWVEQLLHEKWTVEELRDLLRTDKIKRKAPEKTFFTIKEWEALGPEDRAPILAREANTEFNAQDDRNIEWASWSWNPVTGCQHNCPYCYARDIAERFYAQKFEPSLVPGTLKAPGRTRVPANADQNMGLRNVFVCSMADLFGKWVPDDWIEAVLAEVRANPQWNFLFLTKFPIRMAEFEYPDNAWLGTSVDLQARVKNAERAMAKVKATVRWLSLEPLLDRISMDWSIFQWVVIGGATPSTQTSLWIPPREWVWGITADAQKAGCAVYHKNNMASRLRDYPGAVEVELRRPPSAFQYLKILQ